MSHARALFHYSPAQSDVPDAVRRLASEGRYRLVELSSPEAVITAVNRSYPAAVVLDGAAPADDVLALCRQMKGDVFTAVVPLIVYTTDDVEDAAAAALEAGADEVLTPRLSARENELRLSLALVRAERDVNVHPTTRLPGTVQIERDFQERLQSGEKFAVCYADLDHFKEFNDRYGYRRGDRVILIVSRILRDVVRASSASGFVGHIGGDDFIFSLPLEDMRMACETVLEVFDTLIPYQYCEEIREQGFFMGKDRRGMEYEVPLMALSIGVVTNERRTLIHPAEISELATEMKTYAKTFSGSLYLIDRRTGDTPQS